LCRSYGRVFVFKRDLRAGFRQKAGDDRFHFLSNIDLSRKPISNGQVENHADYGRQPFGSSAMDRRHTRHSLTEHFAWAVVLSTSQLVKAQPKLNGTALPE